MQKLYILIFSLCFSINLNAQNNLNGIWKDVNSKKFKNCFLIIAQDKDSIFINHYIEYKGTPMVEYGRGVLKNDSIIYNVKVTLPIPGWSTAGQHHLKIINTNEISGMYFDNKGNSGKLKFTKFLPNNK
jgi:hypothetical protein